MHRMSIKGVWLDENLYSTVTWSIFTTLHSILTALFNMSTTNVFTNKINLLDLGATGRCAKTVKETTANRVDADSDEDTDQTPGTVLDRQGNLGRAVAQGCKCNPCTCATVYRKCRC
ncbi:hypothetical protein K438DRAFT_546534 [Mycena galopus ATCC 62051]|nr:hypothetical protein K438DRAFT_546534 [Mycena galopus ATCC 62051]